MKGWSLVHSVSFMNCGTDLGNHHGQYAVFKVTCMPPSSLFWAYCLLVRLWQVLMLGLNYLVSWASSSNLKGATKIDDRLAQFLFVFLIPITSQITFHHMWPQLKSMNYEKPKENQSGRRFCSISTGWLNFINRQSSLSYAALPITRFSWLNVSCLRMTWSYPWFYMVLSEFLAWFSLESSSPKSMDILEGCIWGGRFHHIFQGNWYCTLVLLFSMAQRSNLTLPPVLAYLRSSNTKGGPSLDWCPGLQIWRNLCHLWGFCNPSFLGVEYPITNANCKPFSLLVWQSLEVSWSFWKDSEKGGVTAVDRGLVISMALCMDVLMKSSYS